MATVNDIFNEINRIENAKTEIGEAIEEKGVQVPENSKIEEYPELVRQIQQGSSDAVLFTPQELTTEQQTQARQNIGAAAPEIFWAEYGVTTVQEIEDAILANKLIALVYQGRVYPYTSKTTQGAYTFDLVESVIIYRVVLASNGTWSNTYFNVEIINNKSQSIETDRASTTKYPSVEAVFNSIGKWGIVSQTLTWDASNEEYNISDIVNGMIPQYFIDLVTEAGATYNETTGYFELNGITNIAYDEMRIIYKCRTSYGTNSVLAIFSTDYYARTNFPVFWGAYASYPYHTPTTVECKYLNNRNAYMTVFAFADRNSLYVCSGSTNNFVQYAAGSTQSRLKEIIGEIRVEALTGTEQFFYKGTYLPALREFRMRGIKCTALNWSGMPVISKDTLLFAITNAFETPAMTWTLHPDAYNRLANDSDILAALAIKTNITLVSA